MRNVDEAYSIVTAAATSTDLDYGGHDVDGNIMPDSRQARCLQANLGRIRRGRTGGEAQAGCRDQVSQGPHGYIPSIKGTRSRFKKVVRPAAMMSAVAHRVAMTATSFGTKVRVSS